MMDGTRYQAHFQPEAWINDQAIPVDAPGVQSWDCTDYARQHAAYLARLGDDDGFGVVDNDDLFKADPAAPAWVRLWSGPFTIRITAGESPPTT